MRNGQHLITHNTRIFADLVSQCWVKSELSPFNVQVLFLRLAVRTYLHSWIPKMWQRREDTGDQSYGQARVQNQHYQASGRIHPVAHDYSSKSNTQSQAL